MIAISEKSKYNVDFHQIVDFVEASHIRFALTINPTVYVSHIRQFWSIARIKTTDEGTKILAIVDVFKSGKYRFNSNIATAVGEGSGTPTEPHHTPSPESKALSTATDEPASLSRDDNQGEAFHTVSGLEAGEDRENIIKTSALPHDSTPRVTSLAADEGDKDKGIAELSGDDAPIKGRSLETGEEAGVERSTERGTVSVPPATEIPTVGVPTGSGLVPTASPIFTTASVVTPYSRRKGKEKMMAREDQRMDEQIQRDAKIARIHAEEELQMLIDGLDRKNEIIAKHLQEYEQSQEELTIREKIKLINELVKYQDHHPKILKYQAHQIKPLSRSNKENSICLSSKATLNRRPNISEGSAKKMKTSEDVSEKDLKEMMQLVPVEEVYVEALQGRIVGNKMLKSFPLPVLKILLLEYFPTASEEMFPLLSQRDAPTEGVCTAVKTRVNRGPRHINISQRRVSVILGMYPMIDPII
nr:hypothetical protein [Tanacetum cinerariifolium]